MSHAAFFRIPPFPKARTTAFTHVPSNNEASGSLIELLRTARVGGAYWGSRPKLPDKYVLAVEPDAVAFVTSLSADPAVLWADHEPNTSQGEALRVSGECDPWHMLAGATKLIVNDDDELRLIASLLGVPTYRLDKLDGMLAPITDDPLVLFNAELGGFYVNPFTAELMNLREVIELSVFWREMIDRNREIVGCLGFAFWKQEHVAPLLWGGGGSVRFFRKIDQIDQRGTVALWRTKVGSEELAAIKQSRVPILEIEDGFLRSNGLGADCVPPLSITVDALGPHFDPAVASELELILQDGEFDQALLARAARLRQVIVDAGVGKYGQSRGCSYDRRAGIRRHILVPGQVEDDRAVQLGGCGLVSNVDLLALVRAEAPDAYIVYKPHPDVVAGHRAGAIHNRAALELADEIVMEGPISSWIEMVDEVHVNTSLSGFEALLHEKRVTTYGVPFYAGWGLTRDLGPVPGRRTARRTLDELIAAALILYPRYIDPVTRLPCPAEIVVDRLARDKEPVAGLLVQLRRLQGRFMRQLRGLNT